MVVSSTACAFQVLPSKHTRACSLSARRQEREREPGRRGEGEMGVSEGFMGVIMESQWLGH